MRLECGAAGAGVSVRDLGACRQALCSVVRGSMVDSAKPVSTRIRHCLILGRSPPRLREEPDNRKQRRPDLMVRSWWKEAVVQFSDPTG